MKNSGSVILKYTMILTVISLLFGCTKKEQNYKQNDLNGNRHT